MSLKNKNLSALAYAPAVALIVWTLFAVNQSQASPSSIAWPLGSKITYYDASLEPWAVSIAAQTWNQAGLAVSFQATSNPQQASLIIENAAPVTLTGYCHLTCIGWTNHLGYNSRSKSRVYLSSALGKNEYERLALHELGHVLGLTHSYSPCSIMSSSAKCWSYRKALMQPYCHLTVDSAWQLKTLYGPIADPDVRCPAISLRQYQAFEYGY